ncbi:hypothetical protein CO009_03095 [Candidatus Shapirobacteria bacterium CG_4_8_14_3_um_filter_35_11]|uniref:DUF5678 domain-containing protein n=5 Tax=Candidatus Shapironibacteriota TaxID=1752721 RepID=A0A1J5HS62_9BACT|nr:MAG: hypothetical protein AUK05_00215 [Candidatus Shapirobacteria bacterium CG2_30_35_20]PIV07695.1 MAG: hypothetical protein COS53_00985 [Candidatus Shapirobacteria bacterium CG03_land_8_20_14_0_80_35_14]PIX67783.1 MAG: hypothetical protein COZ41_03170 [Candidatus Shapirobacteria bacterium CG_4_10_14_3_um_filter_35_13]PJA50977.1 MAG: hypothetical protein CO168_02325 [Candidatus Shapirobacteria bacterium CG_4_9_14_3_um_filter_36_12]PJC79921.1 MAG: hypothetical protein CO009_03095 [Candidatus
MDTNILQKELDYYEKNKELFLKNYSNQFLLIKNEELLGSFTNEVDAYNTGIKKLGNQAFLIKQAIQTKFIQTNYSLYSGLIHASL